MIGKIHITNTTFSARMVGWIKINSDGAAHGSPGFVGGGSIFRDYKGDVLGWNTFWLECDSSLVVDIFNAK
ncbi:hypothetical protein Lal_00011978 [Lupinus albus]|nr:hypothetical protein Lal_00011978 [Lupinus albus]